jgi:hypothetical protein
MLKKHSMTVATNYVYRTKHYGSLAETNNAIKYIILNSPSAGIFKKCDKQLIGWTLSDPLDHSNMLVFILPEFRGTAVFQCLCYASWQQSYMLNHRYFEFIAEDNKASLAVARKVFQLHLSEKRYVQCIIKPRNKLKSR